MIKMRIVWDLKMEKKKGFENGKKKYTHIYKYVCILFND